MGYIFSILKKTNVGIDRKLYYAHSNREAHDKRALLTEDESVIGVTPIIKSDLQKYHNNELPLALKCIIKDMRKGVSNG